MYVLAYNGWLTQNIEAVEILQLTQSTLTLYSCSLYLPCLENFFQS